MRLEPRTLDALHVEDEASFRHVGLYRDLKEVLERDGYRFLVPVGGAEASWDRALFLNLTFWDPDAPSDVLAGPSIDADVIAHAAWHRLAALAVGEAAAAPEALFLGESIASAFDLYLVGRLLGHAPESTFLETQVPAMSDVAAAAGVSEEAFEQLLEEVAADPDRAFEELRQLLFDAARTLVDCAGPVEAAERLEQLADRRWMPLLHHYELSNWILFARARGGAPSADRERARAAALAVDAELRAAARGGSSLDWLEARWVRAHEAGTLRRAAT